MKNFHSEEYSKVLKELDSTENGLSHEEAEKRQKKYGLNELPKEKPLSKAAIFLSQFKSALVYILIFAGIFSLMLGEKIDASVIFGAVLLNVIIGFRQENKANNAITKLKTLVEHKSLVLRDGHELIIDSSLVAVGDIILINAGNRISADARLIEALDLNVNEAALTGESLPADKNIGTVPTGAALADRDNMVFAGTLAVSGLGKAVVTAVGADTEIGKIAQLVQEAKDEQTPLQKRLAYFSRLLGIVFSAICFAIVPVGLLQGHSLLEMIETGVALGVASIPEGLTIAVTFILALGMQRILKEKALTRKLVAAETLGSTTVICTDKTGTLTEGRMHVDHIVIGENEFEVDSPGTRQDAKEAQTVSFALQAAMMCNNAILENPKDALSSWRFIGTPTEVALMSAAVQSGLRKEEILKTETKVDELPFNSANKFMLSLYKREDTFVLYEKGAPERLIEKSRYIYHKGKKISLDAKEKENLEKTYNSLTNQGLRVIGIAYKEFHIAAGELAPEKGKVNWEKIDNDLYFIGFIAIKDPLRAEAADTIKLCQKAGIRPVIITGDHLLTAKAIAKEVGIRSEADRAVTGAQLDDISDEKLLKLVSKINVYARVSPHHKLRIVKALQENGEVAAMTGDGINDSPAIKAADIGISLGTATDIAKETSDIVLLDDNFHTIVSVVKQGRIIFKNIRKVITYLISDSFSEVILIMGSLLLALFADNEIPLAILPAQILWINIVNDGFPNVSLAYEKDHGTVMDEKPINKDEPLLNRQMKEIIFGAGILRDIILFLVFYLFIVKTANLDNDIAYIRTLMFATLGVKSLMSIFSLRAAHTHIWNLNPFSNPQLLAAVGLSFLLLVLGVEWSFLQRFLQTTGLDRTGWMIAFSFGLLSIFLIELVKSRDIIKIKK